MSNRKETIRISFGPSANAISSHLCNLEGLACTNIRFNDDNDDKDLRSPLCDPGVTHRSFRNHHNVTSNRRVYVPRTLFVDTQDGFGDNHRLLSQGTRWDRGLENVSTWGGNVQLYDPKQDQETEGFDAHMNEKSDNQHTTNDQIYQAENNNFEMFHAATEILSNQTSRYECTLEATDFPTIETQNSTSRHMNWDDMEDDEVEESDDENNLHEKERKKQQKIQQNAQKIYDIHTQASHLWNMAYSNSPNSVAWYDYLMPPLPPQHPSFLSLPLFAHNENYDVNQYFPEWDNFVTGYNKNEYIPARWREDILSENLRYLLEETDYLGGFQILSDGCGMGMYAGLTTSLLLELHDECKSARTFSIITENESHNEMFMKENNKESRINGLMSFRKQINYALGLYGLSSHSSLTLPIHLPQCGIAMFPQNNTMKVNSNEVSKLETATSQSLSSQYESAHLSQFQCTASAALALECATLPYRLSKGSSSSPPIAMAGASIVADPFATTDKLNFADFVTSLKPGNRHNILSLGGCFSLENRNANNSPANHKDQTLERILFQGMNVNDEEGKGDSRMRQRNDVKNEFPGIWMNDQTLSDFSYSRSTYARGNVAASDHDSSIRHDFFAIGTSLRPPTSTLMNTTKPSQSFSQPLIQGLIYRGRSPQEIRSLPDRITTCVVPSSVSYLTQFGCYWESLWERSSGSSNATNSPMSWTVLSNSTLSYEKIQTQVTHLSQSLKGNPYYGKSKKHKKHMQNWRAFMKQDIQSNLLPEEEDCIEVLEFFSDISNLYEPHGVDTDEEYMDLED